MTSGEEPTDGASVAPTTCTSSSTTTTIMGAEPNGGASRSMLLVATGANFYHMTDSKDPRGPSVVVNRRPVLSWRPSGSVSVSVTGSACVSVSVSVSGSSSSKSSRHHHKQLGDRKGMRGMNVVVMSRAHPAEEGDGGVLFSATYDTWGKEGASADFVRECGPLVDRRDVIVVIVTADAFTNLLTPDALALLQRLGSTLEARDFALGDRYSYALVCIPGVAARDKLQGNTPKSPQATVAVRLKWSDETGFFGFSTVTMKSSSMVADMEALLSAEPPAECDVTLIAANNESVGAHSNILKARSEYFRTLFKMNPTGPYSFSTIPQATLRNILRYLYTDHVTVDGENVMEIWTMGNLFLLPHLCSLCEKFIADNLTFETSKAILGLAEQSYSPNFINLRELCLHWLATNTKIPEVREYVESLPLEVREEMEAFTCV
ncbi:hypothetical protein Pelo_5168 [Pelomyxa schiedti]|nr:hypothetical protein Pelo_5168 [Pelomyxa schiedti]